MFDASNLLGTARISLVGVSGYLFPELLQLIKGQLSLVIHDRVEVHPVVELASADVGSDETDSQFKKSFLLHVFTVRVLSTVGDRRWREVVLASTLLNSAILFSIEFTVRILSAVGDRCRGELELAPTPLSLSESQNSVHALRGGHELSSANVIRRATHFAPFEPLLFAQKRLGTLATEVPAC